MTILEALKKIVLSNRVKSLAWRSAMMFVAGFVSILADNLELFQLSVEATMFLGLVVGGVSKAINNHLQGRN